MANATIKNAITFLSPPFMSGASITAGTIPVASLVSGGFLDSTSTQTITGIKTFTQQPGTKFTTSFASNNVQYGYLAGAATTSGTKNTIFGYNAGPVLTTRSEDTLVGRNAGLSLTTGTGISTMIGSSAGSAFTVGVSVICLGFEAAKNRTGQNFSVLIGSQVTNGVSTSNNQSTLIGATARGTGVSNLAVGATADAQSFASTSCLGYGATCTAANQIMLGTATEYVHFPGTSSAGAIKLDSAMFMNKSRATVSGSTSGDLTWNQVEQGSSFKQIVIYCGSAAPLVGTASFTFTTPFIKTPAIIINAAAGGPAAAVVTALSTTAVTITGATTTGPIFLEGY